MKRYVVVLAVMALLVVSLAVPAFAGEVALDRANSECSASGLNTDRPGDGRTQSYGQLVKKGVFAPGDELGRATPGFACNGNLAPLQEGR